MPVLLCLFFKFRPSPCFILLQQWKESFLYTRLYFVILIDLFGTDLGVHCPADSHAHCMCCVTSTATVFFQFVYSFLFDFSPCIFASILPVCGVNLSSMSTCLYARLNATLFVFRNPYRSFWHSSRCPLSGRQSCALHALCRCVTSTHTDEVQRLDSNM